MVRVHPSNTDLLQISLFGNKGQLLARRILPPASIDPQEIMLTSLYFEISAASEEAHLQISSKDKYGRLLALSSVPLILLANPGEQAAALPIPKFDEIIWIQSPELNSEVESGEILITGIVWSSSPRPLLAQLISRSGKVLAFGEIYPQALEDQAYSNFEITFDLILDEVQWLQIGISEHSRELAGMLHYSSLEFQLVP